MAVTISLGSSLRDRQILPNSGPHDSHHQCNHHHQQKQHYYHFIYCYHADHYTAATYLLLLAGMALLLAASVDASYEQTCTIATRFRGPHPMGICGNSIPQILSLLCYSEGYNGYRSKRETQQGESEDHSIRNILLNKRDALNYLQRRKPRTAIQRGGRPGYQGITCECCYNRCSIRELQQYCLSSDEDD